MDPRGEDDVFHQTYHAVMGRHPDPGMEDWEVVRAIVHHRYPGRPASVLDPETWLHFLQKAFGEVDLDPVTADLVEEELMALNASGLIAGTGMM